MTSALPIRTIPNNPIITDLITLDCTESPFDPTTELFGYGGPAGENASLWVINLEAVPKRWWRSAVARCHPGLFVLDKRLSHGFIEARARG